MANVRYIGGDFICDELVTVGKLYEKVFVHNKGNVEFYGILDDKGDVLALEDEDMEFFEDYKALVYLTSEDVCQAFKISRRTLNNWINDKGIPYYKISNTLRFEASEVDAWLRKRTELDKNIKVGINK